MSRGSGLQRKDVPEEVIGYTPEEKLRRQQLRELRRRWLKDQELSPREPVLPPRKVGWVEGFWERFLQPEALWKRQVFNIYKAGKFTLVYVFVPLWLAHYIVKYHIKPIPYGIVQRKPAIFPGDKMEEVIPSLPPPPPPPPPPPAEIPELPVCED